MCAHGRALVPSTSLSFYAVEPKYLNLAATKNKLQKTKGMKWKLWSVPFLLVCWDGQTDTHTSHSPLYCSVTEQCYSGLVLVPLRREFRSGFLAGQKLHPAGESGYIPRIRLYNLFIVLSYSSCYMRGNRSNQQLHEINLSASEIVFYKMPY